MFLRRAHYKDYSHITILSSPTSILYYNLSFHFPLQSHCSLPCAQTCLKSVHIIIPLVLTENNNLFFFETEVKLT